MSSFGTSPSDAGWVVFVSGTVSALACVGAGFLADKNAQKAWVLSVFGAGIAAVSFLVSYWVDPFWGFVPLLITGAVFCGACKETKRTSGILNRKQ